MAKRTTKTPPSKTPKFYTREEALAADVDAGRPLELVTLDADGMFPRRCAMIAGQAVPLAAISDGAKLLCDGKKRETVFRILDAAETWACELLDGDPDMKDKGLWKDATELLGHANHLRKALAHKDINQICLSAIQFGVLQEHVRCRAAKYDKKVLHSTASRKALPGARQKKAEKKAARDKPFVDAVQKRMDANKKDSLHSARQYVASQLGVTFDAVRRATASMKPRKKSET